MAYFRGDLEAVARWAPPLGQLLVLTGVIGFVRHALEIFGGNAGTFNWRMSSVTGSILYAYVVAYVPLAVVLWWHRASPRQVGLGLRLAVPFTGMIHLLAPLGNTLFHYHGPRWPELFVRPWLPTFLYFPMGTLAGFTYALIAGTFWMRRLLALSRAKSLVTVLATGAFFFLYCYQLTIAFAFGPGLRLLPLAQLKPGLVGTDQQIQFYITWLSGPLIVALWWLLRPALKAEWPNVMRMRHVVACCWAVFLAASLCFIYL